MPVEKRYSNIEENFIEAQTRILKLEQKFNDERKRFICDFENTFDVQAVPGSGKTTALLAKLVILEKNIDTLDGGILVLSHTNKSVDNIKERLGDLCPQLCNSNYHFIGTIQSFVNDFLAKPYYSMKTGNKIQDIDDDYWVGKFKQGIGKDFIFALEKKFFNKYLDLSVSDNGNLLGFPFSSFAQSYIKSLEVYNSLKNSGVLRYADSFDLGKEYINQYHIIKKILQMRFKYIYIDEMQDLERYQIELIDDIFGYYDENGKYITPCVIQRIGDISQCIFHELSENGEPMRNQRLYKNTGKPYFISGSHRLHEATAKVANIFKLGDVDDIVCEEKEEIEKPTIICFEKGQEKEIGKRFIEKLKEKGYSTNVNLIDKNKEDQLERKRYTAIGRTGKNKIDEQTASGDNKRCLKHYFPDYSKEATPSSRKSKEYFSTMLGYINNYNPDDKGLAHIRKMLLYSMIRPIRGHTNYKIFGISEFLQKLQNEMGEDEYQNFLIEIYNLCKRIQDSNKDKIILIRIKDELINYFNDKINIYYPEITLSEEYKGNILKDKEQQEIKVENKNFIEYEGYYLNIDSVHGTKGQDHEATLYLMTYYIKEDIRYFRQLIGLDKMPKETITNKNINLKKSQKMFYVGFSRAKKRLCYAVLKDYINEEDKVFLDGKGRDIEDLT